NAFRRHVRSRLSGGSHRARRARSARAGRGRGGGHASAAEGGGAERTGRAVGRGTGHDEDAGRGRPARFPDPPAVGRAGDRRSCRSPGLRLRVLDRKSTRLNSSHANISYAVFCLKKKKPQNSIAISRKRSYIGIVTGGRKYLS